MIVRRSSSLLLALACGLLVGSVFAQNEDVIELEEKAITAAAQKISPSVVRIETIGGLEKVGKLLVATGPTTGLVVSEDGYVISSAFSFVQKPTSILVTLPSGARAAASIVARDNARMLVLLRVNTKEKLPVPASVPRSSMQVGQWTIAIGRTFDPSSVSLSAGILSAKDRIWGKAIQTDAKISPVNYGGPLIDIQGQVLGVLVPLSPQGQGGELAGAEWYDSGIGFAVPLDEINQHLDTLKSGKDIHPGLLGISLKPGDIYALPAEIAAVPPASPAAKAGLKPGDVITSIDGAPIVRQAQLKHALGPKYAGEKVKIAVIRKGENKEEKLDFEVELTDVLHPFQHPMLGILPMRGIADKGVVVRHVLPSTPAAEAGIKAGDKVISVAGKDVTDAATLQQQVSSLDPENAVEVKWLRGGEENQAELKLAKLTADVPQDLPPAMIEKDLPPVAEKPATGLIEIKLPEEKNSCLALVPENYHPQVAQGVIVFLPQPGAVDKEKFLTRWKPLAEKYRCIILAPQAADPQKWDPTESAFVRKTLDDLGSHYTLDSTRIVLVGKEASGTMALLVGLEHRDRIRGIATAEAMPPARMKAPETDPVNRLAFFLAFAANSPTKAVAAALQTRLEAAKFPVTIHSLGEKPRDLEAADDEAIFRWLDALDRI